MNSTLRVASSWGSVLGLMLFSWSQVAAGAPRRNCSCHSRIQDGAIISPEATDATFAAVEFATVETVIVIPTGRATLVLNCPAQAGVSIDGRETQSVGTTRQYHLRFDGDCHHCCVTIWLPTSDASGVRECTKTVTVRNHQTVAWTITRQQLEERAVGPSAKRSPPSTAAEESPDAAAKTTDSAPASSPPKGPKLPKSDAIKTKP